LDCNRPGAFEFLNHFDSVFDVLKPSSTADGLSDADVEAKIAERNAAKKSKDFARADQVRQDLAAQGIILEDTKEGVRWKRS
jgi:cysteinyl-tRNA synthetase